MADAQITLFRCDPLNAGTGPAFPILAQRVSDFMREHFIEGEPDMLTRQLLARVVAGDPGVLLLGFWHQTKGKVVGHMLCTLEGTEGKHWVYGWQVQVDGDVGDAVERAFNIVDTWGAERQATNFTMTTYRNEKTWQRKYGFESVRYVMTRPLPYVKDGAKDRE